MVRPRHILVLDDDPINCKVLSSGLAKYKFNVSALHSPKGILEYIEKHQVDMVLLDVLMPEINGLDVLKEIRLHYGKNEIPVIMVTGVEMQNNVVESFALGANDYIVKPVVMDVAVARINAHLATVDVQRDALRKRDLEVTQAMSATYNHEINNPLTIALSELSLLQRSSGAEEACLERLKSSLNRIAEIVKKMRELTDKAEIRYDTYSGQAKIVKIQEE